MDSYERWKEIQLAKRHGDIEYLIEALRDDENRFSVIRYLVKLNATEAIPEIKRLLRASDSHVRNEAVIALGKLHAEDAVQDIEAIARDDPQTWVKSWAIDALRALDAESALRLALTSIDDEDSRLRASCALIIGELGSAKHLPTLIEGLSIESERTTKRVFKKAVRNIRRRE